MALPIPGFTPRGTYASQISPLNSDQQMGLARFRATGHYDPNDPLWKSIDPSYDPNTAQGFTPAIARVINAYQPDVATMRSPEWQALVGQRQMTPGMGTAAPGSIPGMAGATDTKGTSVWNPSGDAQNPWIGSASATTPTQVPTVPGTTAPITSTPSTPSVMQTLTKSPDMTKPLQTQQAPMGIQAAQSLTRTPYAPNGISRALNAPASPRLVGPVPGRATIMPVNPSGTLRGVWS
jgi:hypothetical protein